MAAARAVGEDDPAAEMEALAHRIRSAFQAHYLYDGGLAMSDCQPAPGRF